MSSLPHPANQRYYSGKSNQFFKRPDLYGIMLSYKQTGGQQRALDAGCLWMLDNGAFSGNFNEVKWVEKLGKLRPFIDQCRGVVAPDAVILNASGEFVRGDWQGTLNKLRQYSPVISAYGYPVAYALQDDHPLTAVPWPLFDVLFVAGSTEYKESVAAELIAKEARQRGKVVHIGRVSQLTRMALTWWADSYDGTTFKWEEDAKHKRFDRVLAGDKPFKKSRKQWRLL